jgi:hypothetical protein
METPTTRRSAMTKLVVLGRRRGPIAIAVLAVVLTLPLARALAQDAEEILEDEQLPQNKLFIESGYGYQGEADIDGGGHLTVNRFDVGLLGRTNLTDELRWTNSFFFGVSDYDFGGGGFAAGNPWDTILTMRMVTKLTYQFAEQWGVSAGGVFIFSPESSADWGQSFTGGGLLGVDYRPSKTFFVSLGAAVISQIEDDATVAPQVTMIWLPSEDWAVRVGAVPASGGAAAAGEVAYQIAEPVEIGLGLLYNQRRFRLDNSGPARKGVGEDNNLPLRLRLGWDITKQLSLNLLAGVALSGQLTLDDQNGNRLMRQDYDPAPYIGVRLLGGF